MADISMSKTVKTQPFVSLPMNYVCRGHLVTELQNGQGLEDFCCRLERPMFPLNMQRAYPKEGFRWAQYHQEWYESKGRIKNGKN